MDGRSLEHGLSQKLMGLENAAACISSAKSTLRSNAESVRKEISDCVSEQMSLIRAREQELLAQMDWAMAKKDVQLSEKQHQIHKAIGACQHAIETVRGEGDHVEHAASILNKLGHIDTSLRDGGRFVFEKDALGLRSQIAKFGAVKNVSGENKSSLKSGESLPFESEDYEDDLGMTHKSIDYALRYPTTPTTPTRPSHSDTVKRWLSKLPSGTGALDADLSTLLAEFEVIKAEPCKDAKPDFDEVSDSASFDVISQMSVDSNCTMRPTLFSNEFMQVSYDFPDFLTLQRPLCEWLLGSINLTKESAQTEQERKNSVRNMKRRHSFDTPVSAKRYEFETVMKNVCESSCAEWCLGTSQKESDASEPEGVAPVVTAPLPSTSTAEETQPPRAVFAPSLAPVESVDEKKFVDRLNFLFKEMTFSSTNGQKMSMNNVEQWRALLAKMHTSQEWLAK